jgi:murein L,D-transpeptidase YafK
MKDRHTVELWAQSGGEQHFIKRYYIWNASGGPGPKLVEGDKQVPEGFYSIVGLNPSSKFHLSLELDYPNAFDLKWARIEGRKNPGGEIFIHGKSSSAGCLAMGDKNIEELFILANDVGLRNIRLIIAPSDPRNLPLRVPPGSGHWVAELYKQIAGAFAAYRH